MFLTKSTGKQEGRGFTLVELLVVIAIITTLSSVVFANLTEARKKSRDTGRIQHIAQVQRGLELFFLENKRYPNVDDDLLDPDGEIIGSGGLFDTVISPYLSNPDSDPLWDSSLGDTTTNYPANNELYYYGYDPINPGGQCDPVFFIHKFETNTISSKFTKKDATSGSLDIANADFVFCPEPNTHYSNY